MKHAQDTCEGKCVGTPEHVNETHSTRLTFGKKKKGKKKREVKKKINK